MSQPSHQIVQLSTGSHRSPEDGVCVMELASMLADEPFSDRPASVCPVIAAFLRSYNDGVDDRRRRDLYEYASEAIGTRGSDDDAQRRADLFRIWIRDCHPELAGGPARVVPMRRRMWGTKEDEQVGMVAGRLAAQSVRRNRAGAHEAARALVTRLIACRVSGPLDEPGPEQVAVAPVGTSPWYTRRRSSS
jgi:hypothetical protein